MKLPGGRSLLDYRRLVREGYDRCAPAFAAARAGEERPDLELLLPRLAPGSRVLDLGCGAGVSVAARLAREHALTGSTSRPRSSASRARTWRRRASSSLT
ncbi:MAG TPA: hypothetical protein VMR86_03465 [Myxococcota bacterium]|nr:hypothetical protein [Myxococcota bacterium]